MAGKAQFSLDGLSLEARALVITLRGQQEALEKRLADIEAVLRESSTPVSAHNQSKGAPLTVALNLRGIMGRMTLEVFVKSSGPADFKVEGSANGTDFRFLDSISISDAQGGERHEGYMNAYPVVRVRTDNIGDHEIELVAAR